MTTQAYFEENSPAMLQLEAMVDRVGTKNVLYALSFIAFAKSEHCEHAWQDGVLARAWNSAGMRLDKFAHQFKEPVMI